MRNRRSTFLEMHNKNITILRTSHTDHTVHITKHSQTVTKPQYIIEHSPSKSSIDLPDHMSSYSVSFQRKIKWYQKFAV